jgi:glycerate kinase
MKIVTAIDSFKGSMSSQLANETVKKCLPNHEVEVFPIADGGEGTVEVFVELEDGEIISQPMTSVNNRPDKGHWGWVEKSKTAIIEAAEGAGLIKADAATLHPRNHTSFGMGEQILQALDKGAETIILGLGGTATVDGGIGMLQALGCVFYNPDREPLPVVPVALSLVEEIDTVGMDPRLEHTTLIIASDVINPLCGLNGAVYVFGEQKGLPASELASYDEAMGHYRKAVEKATGRSKGDSAGAGAAGGIGFALLSFFDCRFESGFELLAKRGNLAAKIKSADLVITGEGKFDSQSLQGKVPIGISRMAKKHAVSTVLFVGKAEDGLTSLPKENIAAIIPIVDAPMSLEKAIANGPRLLGQAVDRAFQLVGIGMHISDS